ncbi:p3 protein [Caerostris extrusa]|uniref:P3 protein n=1 Tax=Caerostris extrusa TaxID=172846 RepID=A0AAV4QVA9_CAEEX|nr:p3 protein [Caerostris extrusa]
MAVRILVCFLLLVNYTYGAAEIGTPHVKTTFSIPRIEFYPLELNAVVEGEMRHVSFGITWQNSTDPILANPIRDFSGDFQVYALSEDSAILEIVNSSYPECIRSQR